jgi:hypothetical protein
MITAETAKQAAELYSRGTPLSVIADSWGTSHSTLRAAFKRYGITAARPQTTAAEHIDLQRESGVPPELYAVRAGLTLNTMRRYAWEIKSTLAMNTQAERRTYWLGKIDQLDIKTVKNFAQMHMLPMPMLAQWYHKLVNPSGLLLWGFNQLLVIDGKQFNDFSRYAQPKAELFSIGRGKACVPVDAHIAGEAFKFARTYQHH